MRWDVLCAVVALATFARALQCPTCKGIECRLPNVPMKECSIYHPYPLLQTRLLRTTASYSCLYVEYYTDDELQQMSQCIVIAPGNDVCKALRDKYTVKTCSLKKPQSLVVEELEGVDPVPEGRTTSASSSSSGTPSAASDYPSPAPSGISTVPHPSPSPTAPTGSPTTSPSPTARTGSPTSSITPNSTPSFSPTARTGSPTPSSTPNPTSNPSPTGSLRTASPTSSPTPSPTSSPTKELTGNANPNQISIGVLLTTLAYLW